MLTDQHMGFESGNGKRHHQLLSMPEGQDHPLLFCEQAVHMLRAFGAPGHRAAQHLNDPVADRRHHRNLQRVDDPLPQRLRLSIRR